MANKVFVFEGERERTILIGYKLFLIFVRFISLLVSYLKRGDKLLVACKWCTVDPWSITFTVPIFSKRWCYSFTPVLFELIAQECHLFSILFFVYIINQKTEPGRVKHQCRRIHHHTLLVAHYRWLPRYMYLCFLHCYPMTPWPHPLTLSSAVLYVKQTLLQETV